MPQLPSQGRPDSPRRLSTCMACQSPKPGVRRVRMRQRVDRKNLQSGVQSRTRETAWGALLSLPDNPEEETPHPLGLVRVCFPEGG